MGKRQCTTPVVVRDKKAVVLSPIPPGEVPHDEDWFQDLLFSCPTLLPIDGPILKYFDDGGQFFNFGQLSPRGTLASSAWLSMKSNRLELPDTVWRGYYKTVLSLLNDARLKEDEEPDVPGKNWTFTDALGKDVKIEPLLRHKDEWFSAIKATIALIKPALEKLGE